MGGAIVAYLLLAVSGVQIGRSRHARQSRPRWLRPLHITGGVLLIGLVLLLLAIGIVGTIGHYGSLGHSAHLAAGIGVVDLVALSAWSAVQIQPSRAWARWLHVGTNAILFLAMVWVSLTGWSVVQKYLP